MVWACAENGVDIIRVVRMLFEPQQAGFHFRELLPAFLNEYVGQFVHALFPVFPSGVQDVSQAGMSSGSPSSVARLQKSMTERTSWLWATTLTPLAGPQRFLLEQEQELKSRGVDLAHLPQVEFERAAARERVEQRIFLLERMVDGEIFRQGKPAGVAHGKNSVPRLAFPGRAPG